MNSSNRRKFIKNTACAAVGLILAPWQKLMAKSLRLKKPLRLRQLKGLRFKNRLVPRNRLTAGRSRVYIKGLTANLPDVISVKVSPIKMNNQGRDLRVKFVLRQTKRNSFIVSWFKKRTKRDISFFIRDANFRAKRMINCFGCSPISIDTGSNSSAADMKTISMTCNVSRIEVA